MSAPQFTPVERAAQALYEEFAAGDCNNEYAPWDKLGDKQLWRDRAITALGASGFAELYEALESYLAGADAGHISVEVDNAARAALRKARGETA